MSLAKHILATTDFSHASESALAKAAQLAQTAGSELTLIHVHSLPPLAPEAYVPDDKFLTTEELDRKDIGMLEKIKAERFANLKNVSVMTMEHVSPPLAICDYAQHHEIDLIVIGTHGRTGLKRLLIGSVAESVVRHSHCAVLVVPPGSDPG